MTGLPPSSRRDSLWSGVARSLKSGARAPASSIVMRSPIASLDERAPKALFTSYMLWQWRTRAHCTKVLPRPRERPRQSPRLPRSRPDHHQLLPAREHVVVRHVVPLVDVREERLHPLDGHASGSLHRRAHHQVGASIEQITPVRTPHGLGAAASARHLHASRRIAERQRVDFVLPGLITRVREQPSIARQSRVHLACARGDERTGRPRRTQGSDPEIIIAQLANDGIAIHWTERDAEWRKIGPQQLTRWCTPIPWL